MGHDSEWSNRKQAEIEALRKAADAEIVNRRFGRRHDKPCANPNMLTCAMWECQSQNRCRRQPAPEEGK